MTPGSGDDGDRPAIDIPAIPDFASAEEAKLWLSRRFARETEPRHILAVAAAAIGRHLGAARVAYGEVTDRDRLDIPLDWTRDGVPSIAGGHPLDDRSTMMARYRRGGVVVVDDTDDRAAVPDPDRLLVRTFNRAFVAIPLMHDGQLVALFVVTDDRPRRWHIDEISLVGQTGARIWGALQHLRLTARLRESEEQFRTMAENLPCICWVGDADAVPVWGNRRWHAMYDGTAVIRGDVRDAVHPDDLPRARAIWNAMRAQGSSGEWQVRLRGNDGVYRPSLGKISSIRDADGAVTRWVGVQLDLSGQLAQSRRQVALRSFYDSTRDLTDPAAILRVMSRLLIDHLHVRYFLYFEAAGDGSRLAILDPDDRMPFATPDHARLNQAFEALANRPNWTATRVIDDERATPRSPDDPIAIVADLMQVRSGINVPIVKDDRRVAAMTVLDANPRRWTPDEIDLCEELAEALWAAIARARAEAAIVEREEQFRTLAQNIPALCWLGDPDGRAYWANAQWEEYFGPLSANGGDMAVFVHPADRRRAEIAWRKARGTGTPIEITLNLRDAAGRHRPFRASSVPIHDASGQMSGWCGTLVDLSEREAHSRRQAFLRTFYDATRDLTRAGDILATLGELMIAHIGIGQVTYSEAVADDPACFDVFHARPDHRFDQAPERVGFGSGFEALLDCYRAGRTLVAYDYHDELPELTGAVVAARRAIGMCASISVPLVKDGRLVAMLSAVDPAPRRWTREEVELVEELAERVWAVVSRSRAEAALQERERHQRFLIDWADRIRDESDPAAIVAITLARLGGHFPGVTRATYSEGDETGRWISNRGEWLNGVGSVADTVFDLEEVGVEVAAAWLGGAPVQYDDVTTDPRIPDARRPYFAGSDVRSLVTVPLIEAGRVRCALSLQSKAQRSWRAAEVALVRDVTERVWVAVERARAEAELQQRERNQAFLVAWNDAVRGEGSARAILAQTVRMLADHLGAARVNYAEPDHDFTTMTVIEEYSVGTVTSVRGTTYRVADFGERLAAQQLSGRPVRIDDIATDPLFDDRNRPLFAAIGVHAALTLPMLRGHEIMAVLSVQQDRPRHWTDAEVGLVRDLADRTLAVLERAQSEARLAESEAQLSAFMDHAPVAMNLRDRNGRYIRVNPEFGRAVGRGTEEITGLTPADIFPPCVARQIEAADARALGGEVVRLELSEGLERKYDSVLTIAFPIGDGSGAAKTAGFTIDLTERRRAEAALARSRETLYQSEKLTALGSLLAGVSHELNNPLSIVVAQAVMMERQSQGSPLAERALKIRKAADRCARIVQSFLAMARQKRPEREAVDLNAVATAAHELADYGLKNDGITTFFALTPGLPPILADSDQLHQIVINLIVNAQQAMVQAGAADRTLTLRSGPGEAPGTVMLEVADTGPGIPPEVRRRIFEPFFTTKPQGEGTGVGLSFSQGLAEAHGGTLAVVPAPQGACFRLTLPIGSGDQTGPDAPAAALTPAVPARRALVVDDEQEIAESLADFLSIDGFACDLAVGGAAAKERLAAGTYDLIVSDLRMPGIDGPHLHAWVAAQRPDLVGRMAFATGDTLGHTAARFLADLGRPVLEKPFTPEAVHRLLEQMDLA